MNNEIRWRLRFQNFEKSFEVFQRRVVEYRSHTAMEAYQMALIQSFEMIVELSWKTLKDYMESEGLKITTPKDIIRQAFQSEIINDGEIWMEALKQRNLSSHTYNENTAKEMLDFIDQHFDSAVQDLYYKLKTKP